MNLYKSLKPAKVENGFKMDGYYVWGASVIKGDDGLYYMFASRWKKELPFPEGYMTGSEIVLATSKELEGPYEFKKVIIGKREGGYFDSVMAHNPHIKKIGDKYVLFYIGSPDGTQPARKIGYAVSDDLVNFQLSDNPIDLPPNANNPSVVVLPTGKIMLFFRDGELKVSVAAADKLGTDFRLLAYDLFDGKKIEDMFVFVRNSKYYMVAEDNRAHFTGHSRFGFLAESADGINWEPSKNVIAYDHTIKLEDGSEINAVRRERPQFVFENGKPVCMFTSFFDGENAYNVAQPLDLKENNNA